MTALDYVYVWGQYYSAWNGGGVLFWNTPKLVTGWGTSGGVGAVQSLDAEASYWVAVIGGVPYSLGDNQYTVITQVAQNDYLNTAPQQCCALTNGASFNWAGVGSGTIIQVDGGNHCNAAVDSAGSVFSWGNTQNGCGGTNNTSNNGVAPAAQPTPIQVLGVGGTGHIALKTSYGAITSGQTHFVGLLSTGHVVAWGTDQYGECGDAISLPTSQTGSPLNDPYNAVPVNVVAGAQGGSLLSNITEISAGNHHTVALDASGNVWCWGHNAFGQLGDGTTTDRSSPVAPNWPAGGAGPTFPILAVNGGGGQVTADGQSFAIDSAGQLWAWGANSFGQLGLGNVTSPQTSPVKVPMVAAGATLPILQAYSGTRHALVLDSANVLFTFGDNTVGALGNPSLPNPTTTPTPINSGAFAVLPTSATILKIWAGNQTSMVDLSLAQQGVSPAATQLRAGLMVV